MEFENASFGVSVAGVNQYLEALNAIVLKQVATTLRNTQDVEAAVRAGWHGAAPEQFITNLNKAKEEMVNTLKSLYDSLEVEVKGIRSKILDMDANLVEEE